MGEVARKVAGWIAVLGFAGMVVGLLLMSIIDMPVYETLMVSLGSGAVGMTAALYWFNKGGAVIDDAATEAKSKEMQKAIKSVDKSK